MKNPKKFKKMVYGNYEFFKNIGNFIFFHQFSDVVSLASIPIGIKFSIK
jgi:hypothetical protein